MNSTSPSSASRTRRTRSSSWGRGPSASGAKSPPSGSSAIWAWRGERRAGILQRRQGAGSQRFLLHHPGPCRDDVRRGRAKGEADEGVPALLGSCRISAIQRASSRRTSPSRCWSRGTSRRTTHPRSREPRRRGSRRRGDAPALPSPTADRTEGSLYQQKNRMIVFQHLLLRKAIGAQRSAPLLY